MTNEPNSRTPTAAFPDRYGRILRAVEQLIDAELEASQRRAIRIQTLLDDTRDRVRKLHRPAHYGGRIICVECSAYDGHTSTDSPPVEHPCSTIAALAA